MHSNSEYLKEFKCLRAEICGLLSGVASGHLPDKFLAQDRAMAIEISNRIIDLAGKEIKFIEDLFASDSPDPERLRDCIADLAELMQKSDDKRRFFRYSALIYEYLEDVVTKARRAARTRTPEQRLKLMKEAGLLDEEGYYSSRFFSEETVAKDKACVKASTI